MNLTTAIFLVNKSVRSVRVTYDPDYAYKNNPDKLFKTLDPDIKKDDFVVVPTNTRHGYTVCRVEETDFRVNFDSPNNFEWIVGKVDKAAYDHIKEQEAVVLDRIGDAEENRKRAELTQALGLGDVALSDLDIVTNSAPLPSPATPRGQQGGTIPSTPGN